MSYKPFTTKYTWEIIDDIKEYLKETNKEQTTLDTLDLCHLIGEIERLNNIINEIEKDLEDRYYGRGKYSLSTDIVGIPTFLNRIKELKGE